jgi:hypothetical protein
VLSKALLDSQRYSFLPVSATNRYLRARPLESRPLASFGCRLSRGPWLFPSCCSSFSRFVYGFNRRGQFQLGLFCSAMVAMVQRLDARSFFFHPQLIVSTFSALVLKVCGNRFSCHGRSVAELSPSKLSNFSHSVTIHGPPRARGGGSALQAALIGAGGLT